VTAVCGVVIAGCSATAATPAPTHRSTPTPTPTTAPIPTPTPTPAPLRAPLIIQVENLYAARPQSGLNSADIVYEYDTEGGISRFTAIYFTTPPPSFYVGPIRSARLVSIRLLSVYGGILLYSGASTYTGQQLYRSGLRSYESPEPPMYRLRNASAPPSLGGAPHNLYTDGKSLASWVQGKSLGTVSYRDYPQRTAIAMLPSGGTPVTSFQVPVTAYEQPIYTYQPSTQGYERDEPGGGPYPATGVLDDADTGRPWEPANVVVLQVPRIVVPQDNENASVVPWTDGLDFGITTAGGYAATGPGQLAVGGQIYDITWTQGASGPPQLTLADGQPAPLAPGQVLFELVSQGSTARVIAPTPTPVPATSPTPS
jgi:hypothetical protein